MTKKCPECGSPHDTWGGVAVHLWKKRDADHSHVKSKDGGLEYLAREGHIGADTDTPEDTAADTSDGANTLEVPSGNGSREPEPETPAADGGPSCTGCGAGPDKGAVYDADEYLEAAGDQLPSQTAQAIEGHDYVCTDCWMAFP